MTKNLILLVAVLVQVVHGATSLEGAKSKGFDAWLTDVRKQAVQQGISQATVDKALSGVKYLPQVIELYRNQPEFRFTLDEYLSRVVPENRIVLGKKKLDEHRALLEEISRRYQVEPSVIVALWGIESDFGQTSGSYAVIDAIATLAFASSRTEFFRRELFHALHIVDQGHILPDRMKGSWAGAMGQLQFMPSTYESYAVDYGGDGKIDIWSDLGDAFVSAANYLSRSGWVKDQNWGMEVTLPKEFDRGLLGLSHRRPLSEWRAAGLCGVRGEDLPENLEWMASVIEPDPRSHHVFLVYSNYGVILQWNRSDFFALAVGMLADEIKKRDNENTKEK